MDKTVGVLGGMGPLATVYFLLEVIDQTKAESDQDNVDLIITQRSSTPDRTAAILHGGESPVPIMTADAKRLENAGASFIVIPCNTSSAFTKEVVSAVDIEVVSIVDATVAEIGRRNPTGISKVAILATEGMIASGNYQNALADSGYEALIPNAECQERVTSIIYDYVKASLTPPPELFHKVVEDVRAAGADAIVCGCTELSVVYKDLQITDPTIVDSIASLARVTVLKSGKALREGS